MESASSNLLPFDNEYFVQGMCFVLVIQIFVTLTDLVYGHIRNLERQRAEMRCSIFLKGYGEGPCYNKSCPANGICHFYEKPHWGMVERIRHWIDTKLCGTP